MRAKEARGVVEKERVAVAGSLTRLRNVGCENILRCDSATEGGGIVELGDDAMMMSEDEVCGFYNCLIVRGFPSANQTKRGKVPWIRDINTTCCDTEVE